MEHVQRMRPLDLGLEGKDDLDRCEDELHVTTNTLYFYDMHMAKIFFYGPNNSYTSTTFFRLIIFLCVYIFLPI